MCSHMYFVNIQKHFNYNIDKDIKQLVSFTSSIKNNTLNITIAQVTSLK